MVLECSSVRLMLLHFSITLVSLSRAFHYKEVKFTFASQLPLIKEYSITIYEKSKIVLLETVTCKKTNSSIKTFPYFQCKQPLYGILNITAEIKKSFKYRNTSKCPLNEKCRSGFIRGNCREHFCKSSI